MCSVDDNGAPGPAKILVVEDDERVRQKLAQLLAAWGHRVQTAEDGAAALQIIPAFNPSLIISDLRMPRMGGMALLKKVRRLHPATGFLMLTGCGTIAEAVESTKLGAFNFIQKPLNAQRLEVELTNWLDFSGRERQLEAANRRLRDAGILGELVGQSEKMREIMTLLERVAPSRASVLIAGESGTGKELAARTIHEFSPRKSKPFVAVNCAAIPESLIESELFGHERGAFTGALQQRLGCFELADQGTLLLDEIAEMPAATQAKLLRILEESKFRRIGGKTEIRVDVRTVAATNRVPEEAIASGQLRSDLYYRLNVVTITMPPLRERPEDIESLTIALLAHLSHKYQRSGVTLNGNVLSAFRNYDWPGNVRELRNRLERALVTCPNGVISERDVFPEQTPPGADSQKSALGWNSKLTLEEIEREAILRTLASVNNNRTRAAEILGITAKTLYTKLKAYEGESGRSQSHYPPRP
ncbi:MAG: sigma-54-dependent transcriptional regulator [Terriglobia bacterium]